MIHKIYNPLQFYAVLKSVTSQKKRQAACTQASGDGTLFPIEMEGNYLGAWSVMKTFVTELCTCTMEQAIPSHRVSGFPPCGANETARFAGPALAGRFDRVTTTDFPSADVVRPSVVARAGTTLTIAGDA
jgi:hypothetical protein